MAAAGLLSCSASQSFGWPDAACASPVQSSFSLDNLGVEDFLRLYELSGQHDSDDSRESSPLSEDCHFLLMHEFPVVHPEQGCRQSADPSYGQLSTACSDGIKQEEMPAHEYEEADRTEPLEVFLNSRLDVEGELAMEDAEVPSSGQKRARRAAGRKTHFTSRSAASKLSKRRIQTTATKIKDMKSKAFSGVLLPFGVVKTPSSEGSFSLELLNRKIAELEKNYGCQYY